MEKKNNELKAIRVILTINTCLIAILSFYILFSGNILSSSGTNNNANTTDTAEYDVSMFQSIDESGFMKTAKSSTAKVIYLGRSSCGYCIQFLPVLKQAQQALKYTTYYVDITAVDTSSEDYASMKDLINGMTDTINKRYELTGDKAYTYLYGYTPIIAIVKNNKVVDIQVGYSDYNTFTSWLAENGIK